MKMPQSSNVDSQQFAYWSSPISRAEVQRVIDEYTQALVALQEKFIKLDFAVGFILEKFEVTPEQVSEFMKAKMEEFAQAEAAKEPPKPSLATEV